MPDQAITAGQMTLAVAAIDELRHASDPVTHRLTDHPYELELVTERDSFQALEDEWNRLFERAGLSSQVFQQFNWLWHIHQHYGCEKRDPKPLIVTARDHGRLIMVWPLQLSCANGLCHLSWLSEPVGQYGDVLIDRVPFQLELLEGAWDMICREIKPDVITLRRIRADSRIAEFLKEKGLVCVEKNAAPALDTREAASFDMR